MNLLGDDMTTGIKDSFKVSCVWTAIFENMYTGEIRSRTCHNLITTAGLTMIAKRLAGEANDCNITYVAVGTDSTAPAVGDTTLGAELDRNANSYTAYSGTAITVRGYFGPAEAVGAIEEMALFGEAASAAADSGTMFNHALMSETKTTSETLSIEAVITIS